jgi:hypothetical protein
MTTGSLIRTSGLALIMGGLALAVYILIHPYNQVTGVSAALNPLWLPAHTLHFLGALLVLFGLIGLYARQIPESGQLGLIGFIIAFAATAVFVGTGIITAYLWPVVAHHDPFFVDPLGPMFTEPFFGLGVTEPAYPLLLIGYLVFGVAMLRAAVLAKPPIWLMMVGVVLFCAPVAPAGPLPWIVRVVGGVGFGVGLAWLGLLLRAGAEVPVTRRQAIRAS